MHWPAHISILCLGLSAACLALVSAYSQGPNQDDHHVAETYYDYHIELDKSGYPKRLPCTFMRLNDLDDEQCSLLKLYNQTRVDLMQRDELKWVAESCACQLALLMPRWERAFDGEEVRRVHNLVRIKTNETLQKDHRYPVYFWTDIEFITRQVSIYTSTHDYFYKLQHDPSTRLSPHIKQIVANDQNWRNIGVVCKKISNDRYFLYRYMENLARLDPSVFFRLISNDATIDTVYQASKACKMLLMLKLNRYKLRPDDESIVVANKPDGDTAGSNYVITEDTDDDSRDIESMVFQAKSLLPNNCNKNSDHNADQTALTSSCPIRFDQGDTGDNIKIWLTHNVTAPTIRSMAAVQCGCRLLQFSSIWDTMIKDHDVALMSKALTNYMNSNRVPDVANSPSWVLHGWFRDIMWNLTKSRKGPIKEIVKAMRGGEEDPTGPANVDSGSEALDLLRRGCLVVVLNYDPIIRRKGRFRLIQYLDDLQTISSDPLFVFQLTLQDINLFKIYALSKMCQPIM